MFNDVVLANCDAGTLYQVWRDFAAKLIDRGHASDEELAALNRVALMYGRRMQVQVALSGKDAEPPALPPLIEFLDREDVPEPQMTLVEQEFDGPLWVVNTSNSGDYYLAVDDGEGWYSAGIRFDGCVHFYRYFNLPWGGAPHNPEAENNTDYIHICDIDDMIDRLQALKEMARQHFKGNWPR